MSDIFQDALRAFPVEAGDMKDATLDVLDTADICLKWFEFAWRRLRRIRPHCRGAADS